MVLLSHHKLFTLALGLLLVGTTAHAQRTPPAGSAEALVGLKDGDVVWVTTMDGVERQATFKELQRIRRDPTAPPSPSDTAVLVITLPSGVEEVPLARVQRVQTRDSIGNGVLIGLLAGGAFGFLMAGPGCADDSECAFAGPTLILAGLGAAIGLGVDASMRGRTVVYSAPVSATQINVAPFGVRRGGGVRLSVGW